MIKLTSHRQKYRRIKEEIKSHREYLTTAEKTQQKSDLFTIRESLKNHNKNVKRLSDSISKSQRIRESDSSSIRISLREESETSQNNYDHGGMVKSRKSRNSEKSKVKMLTQISAPNKKSELQIEMTKKIESFFSMSSSEKKKKRKSNSLRVYSSLNKEEERDRRRQKEKMKKYKTDSKQFGSCPLAPIANRLKKKLPFGMKYHNCKFERMNKSESNLRRIKGSDCEGVILKELEMMKGIFQAVFGSYICVNRHYSENYSHLFSKLVFFMGYESQLHSNEEIFASQLIITLQYQIYICLKLNIPKIALECLLNGSKICLDRNQFDSAQKYAEKCLTMAVFYSDSYYQDLCLERISMIQYYKGNIYEAIYVHDNIGKIVPESLEKIKQSYIQEIQLQELERYLFKSSRNKEKLISSHFQKAFSYQEFVIFQNERVPSVKFYQEKSYQALLDTINMERHRQWKGSAQNIKNQIRKQKSAYQIRKVEQHNPNNPAWRRPNMLFSRNKEQSAQIIKTHRSPNRSNREIEYDKKIISRQKAEFLTILNELIDFFRQ